MTCAHCGKPIPSANRRRLYCSDSCKSMAWAKRHPEKAAASDSAYQKRKVRRAWPDAACANCGATFERLRKNHDFCTKECARQVSALRYSLASKYGISVEDFKAMSAAQGGACLVCGVVGPLVVDHCHSSGVVRGLLCRVCNLGIGHMKDDPERLRAAADYLEARRALV